MNASALPSVITYLTDPVGVAWTCLMDVIPLLAWLDLSCLTCIIFVDLAQFCSKAFAGLWPRLIAAFVLTPFVVNHY